MASPAAAVREGRLGGGNGVAAATGPMVGPVVGPLAGLIHSGDPPEAKGRTRVKASQFDELARALQPGQWFNAHKLEPTLKLNAASTRLRKLVREEFGTYRRGVLVAYVTTAGAVIVRRSR